MLTREIAAVIVKETMERLGENVNIFDNNELIKIKLNHLFMIIHGDIWERTEMPNQITAAGYIGDVKIYESSTINRQMESNNPDYQITERNGQLKLRFFYYGHWNELALTK